MRWWMAGFRSFRQEQMLGVCIQPIKRGNQIISHLCCPFGAVWPQALPSKSWTFSPTDKCGCFSSSTFALENAWQQLSAIIGVITFQPAFSIKLNFDYKTKALFPETITDYSENAIHVITWSGSFPVWGLPRSLQRILRVCADCTHVPSDCWDRKSLVTQVRGACLSRSSGPAGSTAPAFLAWFRWSHEFRYLILSWISFS